MYEFRFVVCSDNGGLCGEDTNINKDVDQQLSVVKKRKETKTSQNDFRFKLPIKLEK